MMRVSFEKINQSYDGHPLFQQLDLVIPSGQFFTLLGPSGCGKTTLLRMMAGFVRPDSGRVKFGTDDVTDVPTYRRNVGVVFQDYALFPDRSVAANVAYGLLARNVPSRMATARAVAMLERVGLGALIDRAPMTLSGGQRQRVAMARALVIEPKLLLLDEPLSALDVKLRGELRTLIRDLQREAGITTVFVTHDQEEALTMSDQIAVMNRGEILQIGVPQEIYSRPRTAFAADFVGSANLISIIRELSPASDGLRRIETAAGVVLTESAVSLSASSSLSVRAAEIVLTDSASPLEGELAGVITRSEFRGSTVGYLVNTAAGMIRVDVWLPLQAGLRRNGESVLLRLPRAAHIVRDSAC